VERRAKTRDRQSKKKSRPIGRLFPTSNGMGSRLTQREWKSSVCAGGTPRNRGHESEHHHRPSRRLRNRRRRHGAADAECRYINGSRYLSGVVARADELAEARSILAPAEHERYRFNDSCPFEELQHPRSVRRGRVDRDGRREGRLRARCQLERARDIDRRRGFGYRFVVGASVVRIQIMEICNLREGRGRKKCSLKPPKIPRHHFLGDGSMRGVNPHPLVFGGRCGARRHGRAKNYRSNSGL
jgi:hypothetical protein